MRSKLTHLVALRSKLAVAGPSCLQRAAARCRSAAPVGTPEDPRDDRPPSRRAPSGGGLRTQSADPEGTKVSNAPAPVRQALSRPTRRRRKPRRGTRRAATRGCACPLRQCGSQGQEAFGHTAVVDVNGKPRPRHVFKRVRLRLRVV